MQFGGLSYNGCLDGHQLGEVDVDVEDLGVRQMSGQTLERQSVTIVSVRIHTVSLSRCRGEHQLSAAQVDDNASLAGRQTRQFVFQEPVNHVFDRLHAQPVSPIDLFVFWWGFPIATPNDC